MKYGLPAVVVRCVLVLLLLAGLGGCSLYHTVFHPYRLPTPKPSPEFKAQQKAAKARKKNNEPAGLFKKRVSVDQEAATDVSTPTGGAVPTAVASTETRTLPERSSVRYDKQGLMKKPKLMRRRINKPARKPFKPVKSIRNFFKFKAHAKPNYSPDHRPAPSEPTAQPDVAPDPAPAARP